MRVAMSLGSVGPPPLPKVRAVSNVVYTNPGAQPQQLDLYVPKGPAPAGGRPATRASRGGGWRRVQRGDLGALGLPTRQVRSTRWAVADYQYASETPGTKVWPANFEDVTQAVDGCAAMPSATISTRVGSPPGAKPAGGHLANLLGSDPSSASSKVQAVVDFYYFRPTDGPLLRIRSRPPLPGHIPGGDSRPSPRRLQGRFADRARVLRRSADIDLPGDGRPGQPPRPIDPIRRRPALRGRSRPSRRCPACRTASGSSSIGAGSTCCPTC